MKNLLVLCAVAAAASAGSISWPGATVVTSSSPTYLNTIVPAQKKAFGYSTTQVIGPVQSALPLNYQPHLSYQLPHYSAVPALHHTVVPLPGISYYPSNVFYPSNPGFGPVFPAQQFPDITITPAQPVYPVQTEKPQNQPSQPAGDADTTVIDSADFPQQNNEENKEQVPSTEQPSAPQYPASTFPNFPSIPSGFQDTIPSFPQFPQEGSLIPSFPSLPQFPQEGIQSPSFPSLPQFPSISVPSFPQFPQQPSNPTPSPSPPSFPGDASGGDKGLNDEDTISVESA